MKIATAVRSRRDQWLTALLEKVRHAMSADKSKRCVASTLLANGEDEISRRKSIDLAESICGIAPWF